MPQSSGHDTKADKAQSSNRPPAVLLRERIRSAIERELCSRRGAQMSCHPIVTVEAEAVRLHMPESDFDRRGRNQQFGGPIRSLDPHREGVAPNVDERFQQIAVFKLSCRRSASLPPKAESSPSCHRRASPYPSPACSSCHAAPRAACCIEVRPSGDADRPLVRALPGS